MIDGVSWRILLEDLERVYTQFVRGEKPSFPSKTDSYQKWAKALVDYAQSPMLQEERSYWQKTQKEMKSLPVDFDLGLASRESAQTIEVSLTKAETKDLLQQVPHVYHTQINDILLTALVLAIGDWTKEYALCLSLEGHGREEIIKDIDLSRTVGWFTSIFPVHLSLTNSRDLGEAIKAVKYTLAQIPHKGIGYGILSYLTQEKIASPVPSLNFNYLGQWDNSTSPAALLTFAKESPGSPVSDKNPLFQPLDINSEVKEGELRLLWTYSKHHFHEETIQRISNNFIERLKQLIQHCIRKENQNTLLEKVG